MGRRSDEFVVLVWPKRARLRNGPEPNPAAGLKAKQFHRKNP